MSRAIKEKAQRMGMARQQKQVIKKKEIEILKERNKSLSNCLKKT